MTGPRLTKRPKKVVPPGQSPPWPSQFKLSYYFAFQHLGPASTQQSPQQSASSFTSGHRVPFTVDLNTDYLFADPQSLTLVRSRMPTVEPSFVGITHCLSECLMQEGRHKLTRR